MPVGVHNVLRASVHCGHSREVLAVHEQMGRVLNRDGCWDTLSGCTLISKPFRRLPQLLRIPLRVPAGRIEIVVAQNLGERHEVVSIVGEKLVSHRVPEQVRMNANAKGPMGVHLSESTSGSRISKSGGNSSSICCIRWRGLRSTA